MALAKQTAHLPFGGGLGEDIDEKVIEPPFLAEARDIRHDIANAIRKRRGFEAMNGTDLPTDAEGMNVVFDHNGVPSALGRQGCFIYSQTRDRWHRANISGTAPVTVDFHSTVYQSGKVRNYDLAVSGNFIVETWRRDNGSNGEVWYQIRDAQNKAVLKQPTQTVLVGNPRVVTTNTNGGDVVIFGFNAATPTTLQAVVVTPASSLSVGAAVSIATLVGAYDVSSDGTANIYVAKKHSASTAVSVFRLNTALTVINSQNPLPTLVCNDALAVYYEPTVNQRVFVAAVNGAQVDASWLAQNLAAETHVPAVLSTASPVSEYRENGRITMHARGSTGGILIAASGRAEGATQDRGRARASWQGFDAALSSTTAEFTLPHMLIAGKAYRPALFGPVVPFEYFYGHNEGGVDVRQTAILLLTMDEAEIDGQGNPAGYPIVLARYAGGSAANRDNLAGLAEDALGLHLCHAASYGTKWLQGSTVLTSKRAIGTVAQEEAVRKLSREDPRNGDTGTSPLPAETTYLRFDDATAAKVHEFDFAPAPISVAKFDDITIFASSLCTQFDGVEYAEQTIHFWPELATNLANQAVSAITGGLTSSGPESARRFTVVFTIEDALGNTHRSAPALSSELTLDDGDAIWTAPGPYGVRVRYTLPPLTNFRTERGHRIRVQLYATLEGQPDGLFYFVKEEDPQTEAANAVVGVIEWDGSTPVPDATTGARLLQDQPTLYTSGGVLEAAQPPSLRALAATPRRLFAINSEAPWEIVATKSANSLVSPEWNGALSIITSARHVYTAMAAMDEKVIVTTAEAVFWLSGEGPDNLGRGAFAGPTLIPSDTGCTNPRSMVEGPFGVMFLGRRGFYIVNRGLGIEYVGGPVEVSLRSLTILAAVDVPEEHEVRFFCAENVTLVYQYRRQQWSTRQSAGVHATLAGGRYTVGKHDVGGWAVIRERLEADTNYEDEGIQDSELPDIENKSRIVTAWIKLAGLQGFKRVWRAIILGAHWSGNLIVEVGYNYDPAWVDLRQWDQGTAPLLGSGVRAQLQITPTRQLCQAIRFRLTEDLSGLASRGRGFQFSGITLEYGVRPGRYANLPASSRK
jgi:hypothetical protein